LMSHYKTLSLLRSLKPTELNGDRSVASYLQCRAFSTIRVQPTEPIYHQYVIGPAGHWARPVGIRAATAVCCAQSNQACSKANDHPLIIRLIALPSITQTSSCSMRFVGGEARFNPNRDRESGSWRRAAALRRGPVTVTILKRSEQFVLPV
jgi:hypothetical protein